MELNYVIIFTMLVALGGIMKKILIHAVVFTLVVSGLLMVGCASTWKPYIEVKGIKTEYNIGDTLELDSAMVYYYKDENAGVHSQSAVDISMIEGFSTETPGAFVMTITYEGLKLDILYLVKDDNNSGDDDNSDDEVVLTEIEANLVLSNTLENMCTYAEIRENITASFFGYSTTSYQIVTEDMKYYYEAEDTRSWVVREGNSLYLYDITYETFDEVLMYTKYTMNADEYDVRVYEYSQIAEGSFASASKLGNTYTLVYIQDTIIGSYEQTIIIEDNKIKTNKNKIRTIFFIKIPNHTKYNSKHFTQQ